jgi:hypothetical protein
MPVGWVVGDGPVVIALSLVLLGLVRYVADLPANPSA